MFEPTSRYYPLEVKTHAVTGPDGKARDVRYVARRLPPAADSEATLLEHKVKAGERLDHLAARYLGDASQFWRLADTNVVLRPEEMTDTPGRRIVVALAQS